MQRLCRKVIKRMGRSTTTKLITLSLPLVVFALAGTALAQTPTVVSTRIVTTPSGLKIEVDGQIVTTPLGYLWPAGSRHTIRAFTQQDVYGFTQWTPGGFSAGP